LHNSNVLQLLFTAAHWHGLAKLCLHTNLTLDIMDAVTTDLGAVLCDFQTGICSAYSTQELVREADAHSHRESCRAKAGSATSKKTRLKKAFNLQKYKEHALGDYVETIQRYGTTDSYSTQPVSATETLLFQILIAIDRVNLSTAIQRDGILVQIRRLSSSN
jgi:hypothetical protein